MSWNLSQILLASGSLELKEGFGDSLTMARHGSVCDAMSARFYKTPVI
jgi:hypothetical protein